RKYMSHLGRETFLSPVQWDADGWPIVNHGHYVDVTAEGPLPEPYALPPVPEYDDFSALALGPCWNTLRAPLPQEAYSLAARPGWLTLRGSAVTLDDCATPVFVAQRQRGMACTLETLLDFEPGEGETAGIALLLSNEFYITFGKSRRNGIETLELRRRAEDMEQAQSVPVAAGRITLQIQADCLRYRFRWALQDGVFHEMGTASTRFLACEVAGRSFTGTYAGLFAQGSGTGCRNPAYFDYFMQHVTEPEQ
ncbi:MAG: hypothetical protein PHO41_07825, partial [Eubacteriales bacterium]|nr:hypothetical protein [Eubacteriales bacterium]